MIQVFVLDILRILAKLLILNVSHMGHDLEEWVNVEDIDFEILAKTVFKFFCFILVLALTNSS